MTIILKEVVGMYSQFTPMVTQQQNQMLQQLLNQTNSPPREKVTKVNGRPGAEAYQMGPDSDTLLLDNTAPIVWLVQTDGAGYKTLTPYDITIHKEEKQEDAIKKLETRIERLEEKLNGKPDSSNAKQRKSEHNVTSISSDDER